MGNHSMSATGGTGSGYHAKIVIDQAGYYTVSCGTGGVSYGAGRGGNAQSQPTNGGASALVRKSDNVKIVSAGGGTKGQAWINGGSAGSAGVLSKMSGLVEDTVYVSTNGKNGSYKQTENSNTVNGQNGPISGKTWGSTGMANGSPGGGRVGSAHHGFVFLKFVSKLPPKLYAYYCPGGISEDGTNAYGMVLYCSELLTSDSGATTGSKTIYYYSVEEQIEPWYTGCYVKNNIFQTYEDAIEHPRTINVTQLYSYGFDASATGLYITKAIRCPNLDIYDDGTIGNGGPNLFCYKNEDWGTYAYLPLPTSDWYNLGYRPYYVFGGASYSESTTYDEFELIAVVDEPTIYEDGFGQDGDDESRFYRYSALDVTF